MYKFQIHYRKDKEQIHDSKTVIKHIKKHIIHWEMTIDRSQVVISFKLIIIKDSIPAIPAPIR